MHEIRPKYDSEHPTDQEDCVMVGAQNFGDTNMHASMTYLAPVPGIAMSSNPMAMIPMTYSGSRHSSAELVHNAVSTPQPVPDQGRQQGHLLRFKEANPPPGYKSSWYGNMSFVHDFLFTDSMIHVEFLKFTLTLGKHDDALLIGILERLATPGHAAKLKNPFYEDPCIGAKDYPEAPKNVLGIMVAYTNLLKLKGHGFNVFEFAYLDLSRAGSGAAAKFESLSYLVTAYFTGLLQIAIFIFLCVDHVPAIWEELQKEANGVVNPREDLIPVFVVAIGTSILFSRRAYMQFTEASDFNRVFTKRTRDFESRRILVSQDSLNHRLMLWLNAAVNMGIAICIPVFNLWYLLKSETLDDAILNSLALLFILELDEIVLPSWDIDRIDDELADNFVGEIFHHIQEDDIRVTRHGPGDFKADDKIYVWTPENYVDPDDNKAKNVVFAYKRTSPTTYQKTSYEVTGNKAIEFVEMAREFECGLKFPRYIMETYKCAGLCGFEHREFEEVIKHEAGCPTYLAKAPNKGPKTFIQQVYDPYSEDALFKPV